MNVILWVVAILLAVLFLGAGAMKLTHSKSKLAANPNMAWTEDFSPGVIKLIGALDVLAAVGLSLPALLDVVPILVPLAAAGLVLLMVGAALTWLPLPLSGVPVSVAVIWLSYALLTGMKAPDE